MAICSGKSKRFFVIASRCSTTLLTALIACAGNNPAMGQDATSVAKKAQEITVRIEGATDGSGVVVKSTNNRYLVLTAWHVVKSHQPGEELWITTGDKKKHRMLKGSIRRVGELDLAELEFESDQIYRPADIKNSATLKTGERIFVSGFPLATEAVPRRIFRFTDGIVVANAAIKIPRGYSLLYSNKTLPGMSGGSVLDSEGRLVGIHGQGETDYELSREAQIAVKTGTNQGIPSKLFKAAEVKEPQGELTAADHLAIANSLKEKYQRSWHLLSKEEIRKAEQPESEWNQLANRLITHAQLSNSKTESTEGYILEAIGYSAKINFTSDDDNEWFEEVSKLKGKRKIAAQKALELSKENTDALLLLAASQTFPENSVTYSRILRIEPNNEYAIASRAKEFASQAYIEDDHFLQRRDYRSSHEARLAAIRLYERALDDAKKLRGSRLLDKHGLHEEYPLLLWRLARLHAIGIQPCGRIRCDSTPEWDRVHKLRAEACSIKSFREKTRQRCRIYGGW